jgi:hypothetical protein
MTTRITEPLRPAEPIGFPGITEEEAEKAKIEVAEKPEEEEEEPVEPKPEPKPEPEIPVEVHPLKPEERGFTPEPDWKVVERSAEGEPTVYVDPQGVRHYTPASTVWKEGFKTSEEYLARQRGERVEIEPGKVEFRYAPPYVAIKTAEGKDIHITRPEAIKLSRLKGEELHEAYKTLGIIPKDVSYVEPSLRKSAMEAIEPYRLPDNKYDVVQAIRDKVNPNYLNIVFGKKRVEETRRAIKRLDKELKAFEANYINIGQIKRGVDEWVAIKDWNKLPEKYQAIAIRQGISAMQKAFEADHLRLPDGKWIPIKEWNALPEKYQTIGTRKGFDAMSEAIKKDEQAYKQFVKDLASFRLPTKRATVWSAEKGWGTIDPDKQIQYSQGLISLKEAGFTPATEAEAIALGKSGFDVAAFLRKYPNKVDLVKQYFPEGTAERALEFNRAVEQAAKAQQLYQQTQWFNIKTHKTISDAEYRKLRGAERDKYVKDLPGLILPLDPEWQKLKDRPDTDPEKIAYKAKWFDKVVDTAMFASLAATPYAMGGIGWLGAAATIPKVGLRTIPALVVNPAVKAAIGISKLAALAPTAYVASRFADEIAAGRMQIDWQKFDKLPKTEKDKWADKAGYPADWNKLTDEQRSVVLLSYSKPPEVSREEWARTISENIDKMHEYAGKGSKWLQEHAPAPVTTPVRIASGLVTGVLEGAGYTASVPLLASMVASSVPRGTAPALLSSIRKGMTSFFTETLPDAIRTDPALAAGRITGLFVISPAAMLKLSKAGLARFSPRYVPERAMATEISTIRLRFDKVGEFLKLPPAKRMKLAEQAVNKLLAGEKEVTIAGTKVTMTVKNVPYQQVVGNTLWHFATDIGAFKGRTPVKGKLFTSPQAAVRFGIMSARGKLGKNAGLVEIRVPESYKAKMTKLLSKGEAEVETVFGKDVVLEPIPGWTGKGISANVRLGNYPIRRFTILGTKTTVTKLTPAKLAKLRTLAAKEAFADTFLGWHERMKILKSALTASPKARKVAQSIERLKQATPEVIGKYGEIVNPRQPVPHPSGRGFIKPRVTVVVRNSKGEIMLVKDVTEQSFGLPGGQVDIKWKPGQLGFKRLPDGRYVLTHEGAAHGQVKSETGVGLDNARYLDTYLGKINEYALSGSRIYEALAKTDRFKLKKSEIKDAIWWDGKSEITVYPATFDILKGLAKKYNLDMSKVKIDKSLSVLNKARDKAIVNRLQSGNPIGKATAAQLNKAELASLNRQMYKIAKGRQPELADWITSEGYLSELVELIHGRRKAVKLATSPGVKAQVNELLEQAKRAKTPEEARRLRQQAKELESQAKAEARQVEEKLAEVYNEYGDSIYRPDFYSNSYARWLAMLAGYEATRVDKRLRPYEWVRPPTTRKAEITPPRPAKLAEEYITTIARREPSRVTPYEVATYPGLVRTGLIPEERYTPVPYKDKDKYPVPTKYPSPTPTPIPRPEPEPVPSPRPIPEEPPPEKPLPKVELPSPGISAVRQGEVPPASIAWRQGELKIGGKLKPVWKVIRTPFKKVETQFEKPKDAYVTEGAMSAYRTIQRLGRGKLPKKLLHDMGIMDITIVEEEGKLRIKYKGKGVKTRHAGKASPTVGLAVVT